MNEGTLSTNEILINISSMNASATKLLSTNHNYVPLLKYILDQRFSDAASLPNLKEISKRSGVKYDKMRKQLNQIYHDLVLSVDAEVVFTFSKINYLFVVRGWLNNKVLEAKATNLPVVPRVGEEIVLPFFTAYMETSRFFVEKVSHEFNEDEQLVVISLRAGSYNSYWHYRKDKALEEGEIDYIDLHQLDDFELKKILKVGWVNKFGK